jgi:DNA-binding XRE family transcriptional regulator
VFLKATLVLESGKSKPAIETVISICTVLRTGRLV